MVTLIQLDNNLLLLFSTKNLQTRGNVITDQFSADSETIDTTGDGLLIWRSIPHTYLFNNGANTTIFFLSSLRGGFILNVP